MFFDGRIALRQWLEKRTSKREREKRL